LFDRGVFRKQIRTEIDIDADPLAVWGVLVDLAAYPQWNPVVREAEGRLEAGHRLRLLYQPAGRKPRRFRPRLQVVEPGRELSWQGRPGARFFFESVHRYRLSPKPGGATHVDHDMVFWGALIPPVRSWIEDATREPFQEQNRALKERVEGLIPGSR
jgi:hypothetical protein